MTDTFDSTNTLGIETLKSGRMLTQDPGRPSARTVCTHSTKEDKYFFIFVVDFLLFEKKIYLIFNS